MINNQYWNFLNVQDYGLEKYLVDFYVKGPINTDMYIFIIYLFPFN